jgi:hypothetical protein
MSRKDDIIDVLPAGLPDRKPSGTWNYYIVAQDEHRIFIAVGPFQMKTDAKGFILRAREAGMCIHKHAGFWDWYVLSLPWCRPGPLNDRAGLRFVDVVKGK